MFCYNLHLAAKYRCNPEQFHWEVEIVSETSNFDYTEGIVLLSH